jgi:hypothetical protein
MPLWQLEKAGFSCIAQRFGIVSCHFIVQKHGETFRVNLREGSSSPTGRLWEYKFPACEVVQWSKSGLCLSKW